MPPCIILLYILLSFAKGLLSNYICISLGKNYV
nr:MAG TPA: hypothetical protein [Bacteriophage sp.]